MINTWLFEFFHSLRDPDGATEPTELNEAHQAFAEGVIPALHAASV